MCVGDVNAMASAKMATVSEFGVCSLTIWKMQQMMWIRAVSPARWPQRTCVHLDCWIWFQSAWDLSIAHHFYHHCNNFESCSECYEKWRVKGGGFWSTTCLVRSELHVWSGAMPIRQHFIIFLRGATSHQKAARSCASVCDNRNYEIIDARYCYIFDETWPTQLRTSFVRLWRQTSQAQS